MGEETLGRWAQESENRPREEEHTSDGVEGAEGQLEGEIGAGGEVAPQASPG